MNPTVRSNLDDSYVEGKACSICGKQTLKVVHLGAYPDYVNCDSCGSAFVTEEGGERVMYGKIPAAYPDTNRFALQQWVWPEAIDRRASAERRPTEAGAVPTPTPVVSASEPTPEPAAPQEPAASPEATLPQEEPTQEETPPSSEFGTEGGQPTEAPEETVSGWAPEHTFQDESEAPPEGGPAMVDSEEAPTASIPPEGEPTILGSPGEPATETSTPVGGPESEDDLVDDLWGESPEAAETEPHEAEDSTSEAQVEATAPAPEGDEGPVPPSLIDEGEGGAEEEAPAEPSWLDDAGSPPSSEETPATPSWLDDFEAGAEEGETAATSSWIDEMDAAAADLEASVAQSEGDTGSEAPGEAEFAFPWGETPSEPESQETPEDEWTPFGLGAPPESKAEEEAPEAELPEPVSPFEEGEWDATGLDSGPPISPAEAALPEGATTPADLSEEAEEEGEPDKGEPAAESDQSEAMATAYWGGQGGPVKKAEPPPEPERAEEGTEPARYEPSPDNRYRVVLKGTKAFFPEGVCAHCFYHPAPARLSVLASIARGAGVGEREITTLRVPVCNECKQRASARSEEQHTAQLQAHLIGVLTGLFLVVCGLGFGLLDLKNNLGASLVGLVVLAALGYVGPAVPLLLRASRMPRPADSGFVGSTLRVPGDTESTETAFEWRSERYAHEFRKTNERTAVSDVTRVRILDE